MIVRRVVGNSMLPTLKPGRIILARKKSYGPGDIVIACIDGMEVIKRVQALEPRIILEGDNPSSAHYGDVSKTSIQGVLIWPRVKRALSVKG